MKRTVILILGLFLVACNAATETAVNPPPTNSNQTSPADDADDEAGTTDTLRKTAADYADLEIITLLPRDGIPAIDKPEFISIDEADESYDPDELVIGVAFNGEARAYSVPLLSNHEIVNDTVGGEKIAVTW